MASFREFHIINMMQIYFKSDIIITPNSTISFTIWDFGFIYGEGQDFSSFS